MESLRLTLSFAIILLIIVKFSFSNSMQTPLNVNFDKGNEQQNEFYASKIRVKAATSLIEQKFINKKILCGWIRQ